MSDPARNLTPAAVPPGGPPSSSLLGPLGARFGQLSPGRRKAVGLLVVALIVAAGLVAHFSQQQDFGLLYSGLSEEDAARVVETLRTREVPYQLSADGGTVSVPYQRVAELRLELAASGAVQGGGTGLELFEVSPFGRSELAEQITYTRALQGELARTISGLEPVSQAHVHVGRPRESVFVGSQQEAKASVVVQLMPGRSLSSRQLTGIRALVASSVERLRPERVTVLDSSGAVLAGEGQDEDPAAAGVEREQTLEAYLMRKAQTLLDDAFGARRAVVRVNARLSRSTVQERKEMLSEGVPTRESTTTRSKTKRKGGEPVADDAPGKVGEGEQEQEETITTSYEVGRSVQTVVREAGAVERLTIALLIDESLKEQAPGIEKIVKEAVGFNAKRGDSLESHSVPFAPGEEAEVEAAMAELAQREQIASYARLALLALGILAATILGAVALKKAGSALPAAPAAAPALAGAALQGALPVVSVPAAQDPGGERRRSHVQQDVTGHPEAAGRLLERWLSDAPAGA